MTTMTSAQGTVFKGAMLIAGTTIGGGMLAAPVLMAQAGFLPSLVVYLLCWIVMASTGLLMLEACLWMRRDTNLISLAGMTLGTFGRVLTWAMYLFLFYCLTIAYVVGGGEIVSDAFGGQFSTLMGSLIFVAIFGSMVYCGASVVGRMNLPLMLGLAVTYLAFIILGYRYIQPELLATRHWEGMLPALPIAFAAFGFQGTVPTLATYMGHDPQKTRKAILIGTLIPFVVFTLWQALILGSVPLEGPGGLLEARANGDLAVRPLKDVIQNPWIYQIGQYFAFFALTTSFLGVTLGLLDFLADGLQIKKTWSGRLLLAALVFGPPLLVASVYPGIFLDALNVAGGLGVAVLLALLPTLIVWVGRYRLGIEGPRMLPGGKLVLLLILLFVTFELSVELTKLFTH